MRRYYYHLHFPGERRKAQRAKALPLTNKTRELQSGVAFLQSRGRGGGEGVLGEGERGRGGTFEDSVVKALPLLPRGWASSRQHHAGPKREPRASKRLARVPAPENPRSAKDTHGEDLPLQRLRAHLPPGALQKLPEPLHPHEAPSDPRREASYPGRSSTRSHPGKTDTGTGEDGTSRRLTLPHGRKGGAPRRAGVREAREAPDLVSAKVWPKRAPSETKSGEGNTHARPTARRWPPNTARFLELVRKSARNGSSGWDTASM